MNVHDSQVIETWLEQPWPTGVLAAGGCAEDRPFSRVLASDFGLLPDEFWLTLDEAVAQLEAYSFGAGRAFWIFEGGVLNVARRVDGAWVAAITPREVAHSVQAAVESRLREFVALTD
jgi:hypothetical protein